MKRWILLLIVLLSLAVPVIADHGGTHEEWNGIDLMNIDLVLSEISLNLVLIGSAIIILLTYLSLHYEKKLKKNHKRWLFLGMVIPVVGITLFIASSTIFVNVLSTTGGPVHWHADFEVYKCGEIVELFSPSGLSNRIGTPKLHEHGDQRLHIEGTVVRVPEISLGAFFDVLGGHLDSVSFSLPTDKGLVSVSPGETCNGEAAEMNVFLYEILDPDPTKKTGIVYRQRKLVAFEDHTISPYFNVPPADCIIIEYGPAKERTEHICETYKVRIEKGDLTGG